MAIRSISLNNLEDKFEIINTNIKNVFDFLEPYKYDDTNYKTGNMSFTTPINKINVDGYVIITPYYNHLGKYVFLHLCGILVHSLDLYYLVI